MASALDSGQPRHQGLLSFFKIRRHLEKKREGPGDEVGTPDRAVRVQALSGVIVLCSWARHLTLTVPLSTQEYKWVPAKCLSNLTIC